MTGSCLIDTNVLIDLLSQSPDEAFNERVLAALTNQPAISISTAIELLGWRRHTAQSRSSAVNLLACSKNCL